MTWLNPGAEILKGLHGRARTVGTPDAKARTAARHKRYELKGIRPKRNRTAYWLAWREKNLEHRRKYERTRKRLRLQRAKELNGEPRA